MSSQCAATSYAPLTACKLQEAYHVFEDIFTEDIFLAKFQQHVFVAWEQNSAKKFEAPLWEIHIQHWVLAVELS